MSTNGIGFILAIVIVVVMAIWTSPDQPGQYLSSHGAFIVVLGTAVIAVISVPIVELKRFFAMVKVVAKKELDDRIEIVNTFVEMAAKVRNDMSALGSYADSVKEPFFKDAILLLSQGFDGDSMVRILRRRLEVQKERENAHAMMFKNLGKYPPASGLMGTVMGMIALLATLGQEGAAENIGHSMSVALAATLYGVILANMVILPVADNLLARTQKSIAKREMIVEGILLLKQKTNPVMVREMLLSHLPPALREQVTGGGGGKGASASAA
jgi:chemotaxis protein MotA